MKLLFCGDIVGKAGRLAITNYIPKLKQELQLDLVIANAENAAHGFGITNKTYHELSAAGVDAFTLGNHFLDQPIIADYLDSKTNIIRPLNLNGDYPGKGYMLLFVKGQAVLVVNLMGQLFMKDGVANPFLAMDELLQNFKLQQNVAAIIVDMHAEATSEKNALFYYLDGKVSAALGTHTHIPTQDFRVLAKGTAVQTDIGMCGDYNSIVGMEYQSSLARFLVNSNDKLNYKLPRLEPATKSATLCATLIETNIKTGLSTKIIPIVLGDTLKNTI